MLLPLIIVDQFNYIMMQLLHLAIYCILLIKILIKLIQIIIFWNVMVEMLIVKEIQMVYKIH